MADLAIIVEILEKRRIEFTTVPTSTGGICIAIQNKDITEFVFDEHGTLQEIS